MEILAVDGLGVPFNHRPDNRQALEWAESQSLCLVLPESFLVIIIAAEDHQGVGDGLKDDRHEDAEDEQPLSGILGVGLHVPDRHENLSAI